MIALDVLWHALNLFVLPLGLGALAAGLAKLLWRSELKAVPWTRLAGWAGVAASVAALGGLVWTGRDGRMLTYGAMVMACALALWLTGFVRPGRR